MKYKYISSKENLLIKKIIKLRDDSAFRRENKLALIYGDHLVDEALSKDILNVVLIYEKSIYKYEKLLKKINIINIFIINDLLLKKINQDGNYDICGICEIKSAKFNDEIYLGDCVILENIQDPGNLGNILRLVNAVGLKNVLISNNSVDCYNYKVLRASQGAQFSLDIFSHICLEKFITKYEGQVIATNLSSKKNLFDIDLSYPIAWVFGNEGNGLTDKLLKLIKNHIRVPLIGSIESLNVASATAVCLYEMIRQRHFK